MKYCVTLTAHGNIDHGQDPYSLILPAAEAYGESIEECQEIVRYYIDEHDLGGGNWTGGEVRDADTGEVVGRISYNGRFWPKTK